MIKLDYSSLNLSLTPTSNLLVSYELVSAIEPHSQLLVGHLSLQKQEIAESARIIYLFHKNLVILLMYRMETANSKFLWAVPALSQRKLSNRMGKN